jgi:hypothetical protein
MSAEFLAALAGEGRTVVTVLRTDQYTALGHIQCACLLREATADRLHLLAFPDQEVKE